MAVNVGVWWSLFKCYLRLLSECCNIKSVSLIDDGVGRSALLLEASITNQHSDYTMLAEYCMCTLQK